jgi:hypothetical protein
MVCTPDVTRSLKFVIVTNVKRMKSIRRSQYRRLPFRSYSNSNLVTVRSGMRALPSRLKHVDSFTITHSLFTTRYLLL